MTIYVQPADAFGCGYYRLIWPALALADQGHKVKIIMPTKDRPEVGIGGSFDLRTGRLVDANAPLITDPFGWGREISDASIVVMQRVSGLRNSQAIRMLVRKGVKVIVDMDDDLTKIDPANPAFSALGVKTGNTEFNWRNAHQACLDASLVTVSTPALLRIYAPHGRGVVIENRIPADFLDIPHVDSARFGWPGAVHSHPNDLQVIGPAAARLAREGASYYGVGPDFAYEQGDGALQRALGMDTPPQTSGNVQFDQWGSAIAHLGVGLAPLADTGFNAAKSWLKPLEMMACGVPWVGSPRAEYERLHRLTGVGLLAKKPSDWYRLVKRLIHDPIQRQEMSLKGRAAAAEWTIEGNAWRWIEAWESAR